MIDASGVKEKTSLVRLGLKALQARSLKAGNIPKNLIPLVDLFTGQSRQALGAKPFNIKRGHDAAVDHCPSDVGLG